MSTMHQLLLCKLQHQQRMLVMELLLRTAVQLLLPLLLAVVIVSCNCCMPLSWMQDSLAVQDRLTVYCWISTTHGKQSQVYAMH